jgi:uncharacterized protein (DUF58 family)
MTQSPTTSAPLRGGLIDPRVLMAIRNLEWRARVVVQGFLTGLHRSPYHGFSVEFTEYRQYTPGEDLRYLDWKLLARSDRYYVKRFEDETNLRCHLLVDSSKSMGFGTVGYTKAEYGATLAATLGYFLSTQRDAVGLVRFDDEIREYLPARYRPGHLRRLMVALQRPVEGVATDLKAPLRRVAEIVSKRGLFVLVSDLLAPLDGVEEHLGYLRSRGHEVFLFHILDPAELSFDFDKPALFEDVESGRQLYVDPELIRRQDLDKLGAHEAAIASMCQGLGVEYMRTATDRPLELALFDFLSGRMHRGSKGRRTGTRSGPGKGGGA